VSAAGIHTMQDKIEALRDFPILQCTKDVRAFVGLTSYYIKFVKGFATIVEPLTRLKASKLDSNGHLKPRLCLRR